MRRRGPFLPAAGLVLVALASSCSGSSDHVAMVAGHRFDPAVVTVSVGETVTWTNDGDEAHTVTAYQDSLPDGAGYWASGGASSEAAARRSVERGLVTHGESFETTFDTPGTYEYFCIPHEADGMKGRVVVEP